MQHRNLTQTDCLFNLDGRVAVITGAAGLLGRDHAYVLSRFGANLVLTDLNLEGCKAAAEEISASSDSRVEIEPCDVTSKSDWQELVANVIRTFGRIDVLVNNAGYTNQSRSAGYAAPFIGFPQEDWQQILDVNLTGVFLGCQAVGERMLKQGSGSIINIASMYGVVSPNHRMYPGTGIAQPAAYSVSKAGVIALTRYLATLWAEKGVRVNCITPGGVYNGHTETFSGRYQALCPIRRMADSHEMRGALVYLASDASSYCVGHNLVVDGGWTAW